MTRRTAGSFVLGVAVLGQGCAGVIPGKAPAEIPIAASEDRAGFHVVRGRPGVVIGRPPSNRDSATDLIDRELARLTGFGLVVSPMAASPTQSEVASDETRRIDEAYRRHVDHAAQGALRLYVEVRVNGAGQPARVEIATAGLSREDGWRLKTLFELVRDARLQGADTPRLDVRIEPVDPVRYTASAAAPTGMLGRSSRALHVELPRVARAADREAYTGILADVLVQSTAFLMNDPR